MCKYKDDKEFLRHLCKIIGISEDEIIVDDELISIMLGEPVWLSFYRGYDMNSNTHGIDIFSSLWWLEMYGNIKNLFELLPAIAILYNQDGFVELLSLSDFVAEQDVDPTRINFLGFPSYIENLDLYLRNKKISTEIINNILKSLREEKGIDQDTIKILKDSGKFSKNDLFFFKNVKYLKSKYEFFDDVIDGLKLFYLKYHYHSIFNNELIKIYKEDISKTKEVSLIDRIDDDIQILKRELEN